VCEISYQYAGTTVTIDLDSMITMPDCGGRCWRVVASELPPYGTLVCEHKIEIGD